MRMSITAMAAVAGLAVAAACGGSSYGGGGTAGGNNTPPPPPSNTNTNGNTAGTTHVIQFGGNLGNAYSPSNLTIGVGDTVTWQGSFSFHPLESGSSCTPDGKFSNSSGTSFSHTFDTPGTYPYYCAVHCSMGMTGVITVQ